MWVHKHKQKGVTLVELMIALVLSLFLIIGIVSFYGYFESRKNTIVQRMQLEKNVQDIMYVISGQLRNAGYVSGGLSTKAQVADAGMITAIPNCLIFKYDRDDNDEFVFFGYALDADVVYQYIPSTTAPIADCADLTNWEPMNDPSVVKITAFLPVIQAYADPVGSEQYVRKVDLSMDAELTRVPDIKRSFSQSIYILNDTVSM